MAHYQSLTFRHAFLVVVTLLGVAIMPWLPPMPQSPAYHQFADQRSILGVRHFFNVISGLPFIAVGVAGLIALFKPVKPVIVNEITGAYRLFFAGVLGVGIGSGYYHWAPENDTLFWDRLPMAVAFMAFFTIILGEYVSIKLAEWLFYPLVLIGIFSTSYWYWTELQGRGDLRLYGLVQFVPFLLTPMILWLYQGRFTQGGYYWLFFGLYALAKVFERFDDEVYSILLGVSGHTLKHLLAALGCALFLVQLKKRRQNATDGS